MLLSAAGPAWAHDAIHLSIHDTSAGIVARFKKTWTVAQVRTQSVSQVLAALTPEERRILASKHLRFRIQVPSEIIVVRDAGLGKQPFWLEERGFTKFGKKFKAGGDYEWDLWKRSFPAGEVELGVNSIDGSGRHYAVFVKPESDGAALEISDLYPGQLRVQPAIPGLKPYVDRDEKFEKLPEALAGSTLIQTVYASRSNCKLVNVLTTTDHPSSDRPDLAVLTWAGDPRTTQSIQWRTGPRIKKGRVRFQKKSDYHRFHASPLREVGAATERIETPFVINDPSVHWHTARLVGLEPGTRYVYSIGTGRRDDWTELAEFTTAPAGDAPFSFVYMGDAQNGLDRWGTLVKNAYRERPDVAFYLMAGDLVNRGAERDDWDSLLFNARGVYENRPLVPVLGNHECQGGQPELYLKLFDLPRNGPAGVRPERAYALHYGNALFLILDSNLPPESQTEWLEMQLSRSKATWKFVSYHHPAYASAPKRDNKALRNAWTPIFDKHHVDLALQGHDHAYLRTYPLKNSKRVNDPKKGTIYIVSVSGTKHYDQDPRDYTEQGFTKIATYQVIDLQVSGPRLVYRAYDIDGTIRDHFVIEK